MESDYHRKLRLQSPGTTSWTGHITFFKEMLGGFFLRVSCILPPLVKYFQFSRSGKVALAHTSTCERYIILRCLHTVLKHLQLLEMCNKDKDQKSPCDIVQRGSFLGCLFSHTSKCLLVEINATKDYFLVKQYPPRTFPYTTPYQSTHLKSLCGHI